MLQSLIDWLIKYRGQCRPLLHWVVEFILPSVKHLKGTFHPVDGNVMKWKNSLGSLSSARPGFTGGCSCWCACCMSLLWAGCSPCSTAPSSCGTETSAEVIPSRGSTFVWMRREKNTRECSSVFQCWWTSGGCSVWARRRRPRPSVKNRSRATRRTEHPLQPVWRWEVTAEECTWVESFSSSAALGVFTQITQWDLHKPAFIFLFSSWHFMVQQLWGQRLRSMSLSIPLGPYKLNMKLLCSFALKAGPDFCERFGKIYC